MAQKIKIKRGLEANLPLLDLAEFGFTTDTDKPFIGSLTGNVQIAKEVDRLSDKAETTSQLVLKATQIDLEATDLIALDAQTKANDPLSQIPDNIIPSSKLKQATDADKIQMENLSTAVISAMSGTSPTGTTVVDGGVTTAKIADGATTAIKRTNLGEFAMLSTTVGFVDFDFTNSKIIFPNATTLYHRKKRYFLTTGSALEFSLASVTGSKLLYFDTTTSVLSLVTSASDMVIAETQVLIGAFSVTNQTVVMIGQHMINGRRLNNGAVVVPDLSTEIKNLNGIKAITNIAQNPYFTSDTVWTASYGTKVVSGGTLTLTGSGTGTGPRIAQTVITPLVVGKKYLIRAKVEITNSDATRARITAFGSTGGVTAVVYSIEPPPANTPFIMEGEFTVTSQTGTMSIFIENSYVDATTATGKAMIISGVEIVPLTDDFGAGLEPNHNMISDAINLQLGGKVISPQYILYSAYATDLLNDSPLDIRIKAIESNIVIPTTKYKDKTIACFGDSITATFDYPAKLAILLDATVYNCGIGGTRLATTEGYATGGSYQYFAMTELANCYATGDWTVQDEKNTLLGVLPNYATVKNLDLNTVDYLIMSFGTNDFGLENPLGTSIDMLNYTVRGAANYIVDKLLTAFPNLKICFISPMWRARLSAGDGLDADTNPNGIGLYLREYSEAIIEMAGLNHIPVLDMYRNAGITKYNHTIYLVDGLHPTVPDGTDLYAGKVAGFMVSRV